eukprot:TRINITY_DN16430_c0_g1_i1.p1 TRINITY_DN16430_c0_g1~~TRINITY_DN16430_c0_g1_i1.p1  ORF type:complete len:131 (+),score=15.63 TRINITY_DN16430_c0_g1_i1:65-457(+)
METVCWLWWGLSHPQRFHLPRNATRFQRFLVCIFAEKLKLPDFVLVVIFSIKLRTWLVVLLWLALAPLMHRLELGPIYVMATLFWAIFANLGHRREGEASAYSIFNPGFEELPGTLNAAQIDHQIRAGQL